MGTPILVVTVPLDAFGQRNILPCCQGVQKVVALKHKSHALTPNFGSFEITHRADADAFDKNPARGRLQKPTDQMEQCGFTTSAWPDHGHKLPLFHTEIHPSQCRDLYFTDPVHHLQVFNDHNIFSSSHSDHFTHNPTLLRDPSQPL